MNVFTNTNLSKKILIIQEIRSFETLCAAFWRELFYDRLSFTRKELK